MTNTQGSNYRNKRFTGNGWVSGDVTYPGIINILSIGEHIILVLYNSDLSGAIPNRFPIVITIIIIDAWVEKCSSDHCSHFRPLLFVLGPEGAHIFECIEKES